ncbi:MAG: PilN domain-containing protein [Deltaproteobacteria bacterium]|jgi:type IV pilus assembly protein PilN
MIRINLLPIGKRPVEDRIRKEISVFFLLIFFSLVVMAYFHVGHTREIKRITNEKIQLDKDIRRYQARQKQLDEMKKQAKVIKQKLAVIDTLMKNRDLPVRILDQLAVKIPSDKMWIKNLSQRGNRLTLTGVARGNETIAQFMEALAKSPYIDPNGVDLKQSRQVDIKGYKLKNFNLTAKIVVPPKVEEAQSDKKPDKRT